ncbi:MAG: DUF3291 domain-containing protein [Candidatus Latescibacteria bacterium]|nr:DUF3291 domain-containing protein [Candidatus Latescibacterota bacterium]
MTRLAFLTYGILRESGDHPATKGFVDRSEASFSQAEESVGFIDRHRAIEGQTWGSYATSRFYDEQIHGADVATLSLWMDLESVCAFAYRGIHGEAFQKRRDWFIKPEWPTYAAWWVDDEHCPTWEEAYERHGYLHDNGPSSRVFNFKRPFDEAGSPTELDREKLDELMKANGT